MGIGEKIKKYRIQSNMTQKDLADQLHVTNQAVSRWENDEAEPSFDTLRSMAALFGCTMNDFFDMKSEAPEPIREVKVVERLVPQQGKQVIALCEKCNKPIYDTADVHRFEKRIMHGRTSEMRGYLYCTQCNEARLLQEKNEKIEQTKEEIETLRTQRLRSFLWPSIIFVLFFVISLACFSKKEGEAGGFYLGVAFLSFFFSACLFLKNNFMEDLWSDIAEWGFVRMPGVIMEFSLEGFIIGFLIKIALWILGLILGAITTLLATVVGMFLSVFVYPFAIGKNIKTVNKMLSEIEK